MSDTHDRYTAGKIYIFSPLCIPQGGVFAFDELYIGSCIGWKYIFAIEFFCVHFIPFQS